jgi:hypothetical protein
LCLQLPPFLVTRRLLPMLVLAVLFGMLSSLLGYFLAQALNGSIAGAMVSVSGIMFGLVFALRRQMKGLRMST